MREAHADEFHFARHALGIAVEEVDAPGRRLPAEHPHQFSAQF